jgi:hypothetical protein
MGGKNYNQKSIDHERQTAALERQAEGEWAQAFFRTLVGKAVNNVDTLGSCIVVAVHMELRRVVVRPVNGQQLYEAPFRRVTLG